MFEVIPFRQFFLSLFKVSNAFHDSI